MRADWLEELGPALPPRTWHRPEPQVIEGRFCRLEPLDLARHSADLFDQMIRWTLNP